MSSKINGILGYDLKLLRPPYGAVNNTVKEYNSNLKALKVYSDTFEAEENGVIGLISANTFKLIGGNKYTLSFSAKSSSWTSTLDYIYILNYDEGGSNQHLKNVDIGGASADLDTIRQSVTFTASGTMNEARVLIGCNDATVETNKKGFLIRNIKLEEGDKATSWCNSDNDIKYELTQTNNTVSELSVDLEGITSRVSNVETTQTTQNNNIKSLTSRMSTAEEKITPTAIINTVSSTINTAKNDAISSANSNTANLLKSYSTTTQMNTAINQKANEITSSVSSTYTTKTEFNNLKIGGKNLLLNTAFEGAEYGTLTVPKWKSTGEGFIHSSSENFPGGIYLSNKTTSSSTLYQKISSDIIPKGTELTLSYHILIQDNVTSGTTQVRYYDADGNLLKLQTLAETSGTKVHTFTTPTDIDYADFAFFIANFGVSDTSVTTAYSIRINNIMLEKSNKASNWTPAPEDVDEKFTDYSTTVEMNSAIDQKASSILSTVSSTYATKSNVEQNYATKSSMEQTSTDLTLKFSESGGYNLVRNSTFKNGTELWTGAGNSTLVPYTFANSQCVRVKSTETATSDNFAIKYTGNDISIVENRYYSLSYKMKSYSGLLYTDMNYHFITHSSGNLGIKGQPEYSISYQSVGGSYYRVKITFKSNTTLDNCGLLIGCSNVNSTANTTGFGITEVMFQEGRISTDWTPHPSEIYEGIISIDKDGLTVTHSGTGNYSKMTSSGFMRYVNNSKKYYHYLISTGTVNVEYGRPATVQLPDEFKGKNFYVTVSAFKVNVTHNWDGLNDIDSFVASKDTTNGTFTIEGMVNAINREQGTLDVSYVVIA